MWGISFTACTRNGIWSRPRKPWRESSEAKGSKHTCAAVARLLKTWWANAEVPPGLLDAPCELCQRSLPQALQEIRTRCKPEDVYLCEHVLLPFIGPKLPEKLSSHNLLLIPSCFSGMVKDDFHSRPHPHHVPVGHFSARDPPKRIRGPESTLTLRPLQHLRSSLARTGPSHSEDKAHRNRSGHARIQIALRLHTASGISACSYQLSTEHSNSAGLGMATGKLLCVRRAEVQAPPSRARTSSLAERSIGVFLWHLTTADLHSSSTDWPVWH